MPCNGLLVRLYRSGHPDRWATFADPEYYAIRGKECAITLERRPQYCDRGNWIAKLYAIGALAGDLDSADLWPRFYFSTNAARSEVEAWLKKRGQWLDDGHEASSFSSFFS